MRGLLDMPATPKKTRKAKGSRCKGIESRPHCRNKVAVRMSGPKKGQRKGALCHACRSAVWRENSPMRAAYVRLKSHAAGRGIEFRISFRHFECFAIKSELIEKTGATADSLTVDRRDNLKGYVIGNIQPLTRARNSEKRAKHDEIRMRKGFAWKANY